MNFFSKQFCTQYTGRGRWCGCGLFSLSWSFSLWLAMGSLRMQPPGGARSNKTYNHPICLFASALGKVCWHTAYQQPITSLRCSVSSLSVQHAEVQFGAVARGRERTVYRHNRIKLLSLYISCHVIPVAYCTSLLFLFFFPPRSHSWWCSPFIRSVWVSKLPTPLENQQQCFGSEF